MGGRRESVRAGGCGGGGVFLRRRTNRGFCWGRLARVFGCSQTVEFKPWRAAVEPISTMDRGRKRALASHEPWQSPRTEIYWWSTPASTRCVASSGARDRPHRVGAPRRANHSLLSRLTASPRRARGALEVIPMRGLKLVWGVGLLSVAVLAQHSSPLLPRIDGHYRIQTVNFAERDWRLGDFCHVGYSLGPAPLGDVR